MLHVIFYLFSICCQDYTFWGEGWKYDHTHDEIARLWMHAASAGVFAILKYFLAGLDLNKSNCI